MKLQKFKWLYLLLCIFLLEGFSLLPEAPAVSEVEQPGKPVPGTANTPYTLEQLIQLVQQNSLPMKMADLDRRIAVEEYRDTRALANPEWEYSRGRGESAEEPGKTVIWGTSLKWSLPNPIYRCYFLEAARTHITEAEIQAEICRRETIKDLAAHFYKLQLYNKVKTFLDEKRRILEQAGNISKAKVDIGEAKEIDYLRASVAIQENNTELFRIEKNIAYEKSRLREFVNFSIPDDFTIAGAFTFTPLPPVLDIDGKNAAPSLETAPLIRLETNRLHGENAGVKAARFSIIESIDLFGEKGKEIDGNTWSIGVGVSIPLFNRNSALLRQAKLKKEKAKTELQYTRTRFSADIQQIYSEIRILEKEIETFTDASLKAGKVNMELSEKLYREGEIPLLVFLDAQDSFFETQTRYYEAITEWSILKAELDALLGGNL